MEIGNTITITKADYSQVVGTIVKVSSQEIILDLGRGVKGVEENVWLTIKDDNGKEHIGIFIISFENK
jgi:hypothetical protein